MTTTVSRLKSNALVESLEEYPLVDEGTIISDSKVTWVKKA